MTYVITPDCLADYSCVEICPVNCIAPRPDDEAFEAAEQLYIDPTRCIECAACVDACPVGAIFAAHSLPARWQQYEQINREHFSGSGPRTSR